MDPKRTLNGRSVVRVLLAALAAATGMYAEAPLADDREGYLRAAAQRDVATFEALDRDRNGRLGIDEVRGTIDLEARFSDFDINRDGFITRAELARYVALEYGVAIVP